MGSYSRFVGDFVKGSKAVNTRIAFPPVGQLSPQPWLNSPETKAVLSALMVEGTEVRFIGGCVRDTIAHRPIKDIDLATPLPPDQTVSLLQKAGIKVIPTGIDHGTVTAVGAQGTHYEITTLRRDVETDGRHATVAFTDDWYADAARRDFSINALSADLEGRVYDYFNGLQDLGAGKVRFIGLPAQRLEEDILRLLRFFRFSAFYGADGALDGNALEACRVAAPKLATLSGERIAQELFRLLQAPDPATMLMVMQGQGILAPILPDMRSFDVLKILQWLETKAMVRPTVQVDPLRRLAATLQLEAGESCTLPNRLRLSNAQTNRLMAMITLPRPCGGTTKLELRQMLYRQGAAMVRDLLLLAWASERAGGELLLAENSQRWMALLDVVDHWQPVQLPVSGTDCLSLGAKEGPQCGNALAEVEEWWVAQDFMPDRAACLEKLRSVLAL